VTGDVLAIAAGVLGLVTGALAALAFRASEREQAAQAEVVMPMPAPVLPPGVADVLAVLPASAVVLDAGDDVLRASPSAYSLGLVRDGRLRLTRLLELARTVRRDGEIREEELELPRGPLGGGTRSVLARLAPLGSSMVLVLVEDRTEAVRIDAVRRDFVANVSHELKTPVGALALLAEALVNAADDPETVRRFAGQMQREAGRLSRLVQDVIDLSRLQGDDPLGAPTNVAVDAVITEAVDRSALTAQSRGIALATATPSGLCVRGDAQQLVMALSNLVENAVRYSPDSSRVALSARSVLVPGGEIVEISVTDEGPGIPEEERSRIFERFYRIDAARSRDTGGTGLGLAIVKHVAASHGGEVTVWSAEGAGSTFTLRLPAAPHSTIKETA
jgi:two-component system sensor histidine kinase SenX3